MEPPAQVPDGRVRRQQNTVDKDEYPQTAELERRCVTILADLWGGARTTGPRGCSTTGSSEACMLAGMAMKWSCRDQGAPAPRPTDQPRDGSQRAGALDYFAATRMSSPGSSRWTATAPTSTAESAAAACDENTIGVVAILGSTFDGSYGPSRGDQRRARCDAAAARRVRRGPSTSTAHPARWSRRSSIARSPGTFTSIELRSINASGHKYGLVYPGVGWVLWRDAADLPEDRLRGLPRRPDADLRVELLAAGRAGGRAVLHLRLGPPASPRCNAGCRDAAIYLSAEFTGMGPFDLLSGRASLRLPFVDQQFNRKTVCTPSACPPAAHARLAAVPGLPSSRRSGDLAVLRVVVRNGFS